MDCNHMSSSDWPVTSETEQNPRDQNSPSSILISGLLKCIPAILTAAKSFGVQVSMLEKWELTQAEGLPSCTWVVADFEQDDLKNLHRLVRLIGPTALLEIVETKYDISKLSHPLYCLAMRDLTLSFTGFRDKVHLGTLVDLVQAMGGKVKRNMDSSITHLVANTNLSKRYEYAAQHGIPIMNQEWISNNWQRRKLVGALAIDGTMLNCRYKAFTNLKVCFYGFEQADMAEMISKLQENGGEVVTLEHPGCTHVVVNDLLAMSMPSLASQNAAVVSARWFWYSVQCSACMPVSKFRVQGQELSSRGSQSSMQSLYHGTKQWLPDLILGTSKTRPHGTKFEWETESEEGTPLSMSQQQKRALFELLHTEENYVKVLDAILQMKSDIENPECPLLASTQTKLIFGYVLPIQKLHTKLLQDLQTTIQQCSVNVNVGRIILSYIGDMNIAYPAYVNFYEDSRKTLLQCMETNEKFNLYLQKAKDLPMCGRQTLDELMIRPIQRLGSMVLLLKSLLKTMDTSCDEYLCVLEAKNELGLVMKHVNEDKRKTEKLYKIFDVFNKINSCPPHLVSANRHLLLHFEAKELTNKLSGRGDLLMFFLFTDVLEVARVRRRPKVGTSVDCSGSAAEENTTAKPYKHVALIPLNKVWRFVNICSPDCELVFALSFHSNLAESYYVFTLQTDALKKPDLLRILSQQKATLTGKAYPKPGQQG